MENSNKVLDKIKNEYDKYINFLKSKNADFIIENAYEIVFKKQIVSEVEHREFSSDEIRALNKHNGILDELYSEWLKTDGEDRECLNFAINKRINSIKERFRKMKNRNARWRKEEWYKYV